MLCCYFIYSQLLSKTIPVSLDVKKKNWGSLNHQVAKSDKMSLEVHGVTLRGAAEGAEDQDALGDFAESLQVIGAGGEEGRSWETLGKVS